MASMILGSIGSSLLGPLGGMLGSALGGMVDQMIFGGGDDANRIDDLRVTRADPGAAIPLVYGADRIPGIVISTTDLQETKEKEKFSLESMIGKGGNSTYAYHVDIDYLLCEGPILGVARIWADGNLVRGTIVEMEANTQDHPENIGGIPYPSHYRAHLYSPNKIPWSIDNAVYPNTQVDEGKFYVTNVPKTQMIQIDRDTANYLLEQTTVIVYWKDTSTGYYIPMELSHGYTGEPPENHDSMGGSFLNFNDITATSATTYEGVTTYGYGYQKIILADLGEYYKDDSYTAQSGGIMNVIVPVNVYTNWNAWGYTVVTQVDFYAGGDDYEVIDGTKVGAYLGPGAPDSYDVTYVGSSGNSRQYLHTYSGIPIPEGTRYIVINVMVLPALSIITAVDARIERVDIKFLAEMGTSARDWPAYWNLYDAINDWSPRGVLSFEGPDDVIVYHGGEYQPADPVMEIAMEMPVPAYKRRAHVVFDTLPLEEYSNRIPQFSFEVVQYDDVRVSDVIVDIMQRAEIEEKYFDIELPDDEGNFVMGYSVPSKMSFRAALEALLEAFNVDVAEIGNSLLFRDKYREVDYIIDRRDLSAVEAGDELSDPLKLSFRNPVDMPRRLTVRFKDTERNYQPNTAHYQRQQGIQVQDGGVELPVVMAPGRAKDYARSKMRDIWTERTSGKVDVPHKYVYIYPTDIVLIDGTYTGEDSFTMKVKQVTRGDNGLIEIEGVMWDTHLTTHEMRRNSNMDSSTWRHGGFVDHTIPHTEYLLYDLPPLLDSHAGYGMYAAASGVTDNWNGAILYRSVDGGINFSPATAMLGGAALGYVYAGALLDRPAEYFDMDSKVRVRFLHPNVSLASVQLEDILRGANAIIMGDEVVQFMDAVKVATNTWELSTFLRGRRGTDQPAITSGHIAGENVAAISSYGITPYDDGRPYINQELQYKAGAPGKVIEELTPRPFTNTGKRITPFAPSFITGTRDGSNDLTISWVRRDRLYHVQYGGADLRNSEDILQFEVDIVLGGAVVRTIIVDDAVETVYSAVDQTTDGITPGNPIEVNIYQMSATIGRGNKGAAVV